MARRIRASNFRSRKKTPVAKTQTSINGGGEVVLYEAPDGQIRLDVRLEQDTVWLAPSADGRALRQKRPYNLGAHQKRI
jgi:hypothetical protein